MSKTGANASRTARLLEAFHEESTNATSKDLRLLLRLGPFLGPYRRALWLSVVATLATAAFALARPKVMMATIDDGVMAKDPAVLVRGGLWVMGLVLLEQVLVYVQTWTTQLAGASAMGDLREKLFAHLHRLRLGFFDQQPVGRLVTRVTNDVDAITELFASGALAALGDLVRLVGIIVAMLLLDARLALYAFAAVPPVVLLLNWVRGRSRDAYRTIRGKTARLNAMLNEQLVGVSVVQAFGREAAAQAEFDEVNAGFRDANIKSLRYEAIQDAAIESVAAVCLAIVVVSLGHHPSTFGTLVAFNAYLLLFFEPISALAQRYTLLQSALAGCERVFGLLDVDQFDLPPAPASPAGRQLDGPSGALVVLPPQREEAPLPLLSFRGVTFAYRKAQPVLADFSLEIAQGEKVALVGPTGSGKTTVTALLLGLYPIEAGEILIAGRSTRDMSRNDLRQHFAVVPQEPTLFPGTVASNVAAGAEVDERKVTQILDRLGALELFAQRPQGIHAAVSEQGSNFSAGERQLLAFARALYRDAPVLILDEATASVDPDTERRLQRALVPLLEGRTALVIAHRLSTIRSADRILVLQRGVIVEQGRHEQLLGAGGLYARLHALQHR